MKKPLFIFEGYDFDFKKRQAVFSYAFKNKVNFQEKIIFPSQLPFSSFSTAELDNFLFNVHIAGGVSYWKAYCSLDIQIKSGKLNKKQALFWQKFYQKGLGQFYWENKLSPQKNKLAFPYEANFSPSVSHRNDLKGKIVPWGGGKDSIVVAEILKKQKEDFVLFSLNTSRPQQKAAKVAGKPYYIAQRLLDKKIFSADFPYHGHVPVTGYYAFLEALFCFLFGFKSIVMANERSANYGNLQYLGLEVNHQYSKSEEFSLDFQSYLKEFLTPDIEYFSLLRGWYEVKIAQIFSRFPQYFSAFSSCNANFFWQKKRRLRRRLWCNNCPKCAFVFLLLAAFLPKKDVLAIFEEDLFNKKKLEPLFQQLLGKQGTKPLECVGRAREAQWALAKIITKGEFSSSYFIQKAKSWAQPSLWLKSEKELFGWKKSPEVPPKYQKLLQNYV